VCETGVSAIDTLMLLAGYIDLTGIREAKEPENAMEAQNSTSGLSSTAATGFIPCQA
jgi:hypothetical protein